MKLIPNSSAHCLLHLPEARAAASPWRLRRVLVPADGLRAARTKELPALVASKGPFFLPRHALMSEDDEVAAAGAPWVGGGSGGLGIGLSEQLPPHRNLNSSQSRYAPARRHHASLGCRRLPTASCAEAEWLPAEERLAGAAGATSGPVRFPRRCGPPPPPHARAARRSS